MPSGKSVNPPLHFGGGAQWLGTTKCVVLIPQQIRTFGKKSKTQAEQENQIPVMRKDFHLLEAARISDQTIISLERRVRRHFAYAAQRVDEIEDIVWVNPNRTEEEEPLVWLQNGAPPEDHRKLRTWGIV